jgi:hypothetical protein
MKRLSLGAALMVFAILYLGQVVCFAKDPGRGSRDQVMDYKAQYIKQKRTTDSLSEVVLGIEKHLSITELELNSLKSTDDILSKNIEEQRSRSHKHMIYFTVFISLVMLISILMLVMLWHKYNKKLSNLIEDQEKTNEAVNLNIKNSTEEFSAINEALDKLRDRNGS